MEQLEKNLERFKKPAMALVGGIGAALVIATLPHVYLEKFIGATGISEIISAAAPPLGNTARGLIAVAAGLVTASAIFFFLNHKQTDSKGGSDMGLALRKNLTNDEPVEDKPRFSLPKFSLKKLLQKPVKDQKQKKGKVMDLADLPQLRETDSHPDAPARRPIFAEEDLGTPLTEQIKPFEESPEVAEHAPAAEITPTRFFEEKSLAAPEPARDESALDISDQLSTQKTEMVADVDEVAAEHVSRPVTDDLSKLSIAELADRLQSGLARLKELESLEHRDGGEQVAGGINVVSSEAPVHTPPPLKPVEDSPEQPLDTRQAEMDAALKAALGTLEKMTAQR